MATLAQGEARTIVVNPSGPPSNTLTAVLPPGVTISLESVLAAIDASGAGDTTALLEIADSSGAVIARKAQGQVVTGGVVGSATWALRLTDEETVVVPPAAGIKFDTDNEGGWLDVTTNNKDPLGRGAHFLDKSGGGILLDLDGLESQLKLTVTDVTLQAERNLILETNGGTVTVDSSSDVKTRIGGTSVIEAKLQAPATRQLGFFNHAPVAQQGAPASAQAIANALAAYGLLAAAGTVPAGLQFGTNNTGTYLDVTTTGEDGAQGILLHDTDAAGAINLISDFAQIVLTAAFYVGLQGGSATPCFMQIDDTGYAMNLSAGAALTVYDSGGNPIFLVDENGDLHGLTGHALTFDL